MEGKHGDGGSGGAGVVLREERSRLLARRQPERTRSYRPWLWAIALVLVLALAGELFLPGVVARGAEMALAAASGGKAGDLKVRLVAYPSARMLLGQLESITVESRNIKAGNLVIDRLQATVGKVSLNLARLLTEGVLDVRRGAGLSASLAISEDSLNRYLLEGVKALREPRLDLAPDVVTLTGILTYNKRDFQVRAAGRFVASGKSGVAFRVEGLSLDGEALPAGFRDKLMSLLGGDDLVLDLAKLPQPMVVRDIVVTDDMLTILASTPEDAAR